MSLVFQLISPEDLLSSQLDELSMITYLSQFQHASLKTGAPLRARVRAFGPGLLSGKVYVDDPTNFTVETFTAGTLDISVLDPERNCVEVRMRFDMSHLVEKRTMWFLNRPDTNQAVQSQKQAGSLKFRI